MSFLKDLVVTKEITFDFKSMFCDLNAGIRHCEWLKINKELCLSIQASAMHYCTPRANVELEEYTHFELAIIVNQGLTHNLCILEKFERYNELLEYWEDGVFAYVPKDIIEDLYIWCKKVYTGDVCGY